MLNAFPIIKSANCNMTALITSKNKPSVKNVSGNVKIIKIGRKKIFKMEIIMAAKSAAPKLLTWITFGNKYAIIMKNTAFNTSCNTYIIRLPYFLNHCASQK